MLLGLQEIDSPGCAGHLMLVRCPGARYPTFLRPSRSARAADRPRRACRQPPLGLAPRDPGRLLGEVPAERLQALAKDRKFLRRLQLAVGDLRDYVDGDRWYQGQDAKAGSIAYFSPEYGITHVLPQYSGGLGILAGDHLTAASDLGVPLIGVGLLYRHGYF